ncbi:MAG: oligosaccharide flippase family protein [Clostridium sp.]|nr:oligosaccharide flippase family protein [Clostridium sp.]
MIIKIRDKISTLLNLKIVINGIWLYILQIFNTVIPLITLPFITRILGPSQYGTFSSALNLVGYFQVIVEYGFNLSGTRKVALAKDEDEISKLYSRIIMSKLFLCGFTFMIMIIISIVIKVSTEQLFCMIILYSMVLGAAIQQTWFFQGLEDMKYITIVSVVSRTISVIIVFILINNYDQVYLYSILYSLTYLLMGMFSVIVIKLKYKIKFKKVILVDIFSELKDGWYLFTTSAMSKIFGGIGITVLIFTSTSKYVGIYTAIQKIPLMVAMMYFPIGQVIYPYISKFYQHSFDNGVNQIKEISKFILPIFGGISLILIIFSEFVIRVLYGFEYSIYSRLLLPLTIWMMLSILNNLLGIQILVASGHKKEYSSAFRVGVSAIIILNIILGNLAEMNGIAIAAMLAELILTIAIIFQIRVIKRKI